MYIDDELAASNEEVCKDFLMLFHLVRVGLQEDFWFEHGYPFKDKKANASLCFLKLRKVCLKDSCSTEAIRFVSCLEIYLCWTKGIYILILHIKRSQRNISYFYLVSFAT